MALEIRVHLSPLILRKFEKTKLNNVAAPTKDTATKQKLFLQSTTVVHFAQSSFRIIYAIAQSSVKYLFKVSLKCDYSSRVSLIGASTIRIREFRETDSLI